MPFTRKFAAILSVVITFLLAAIPASAEGDRNFRLPAGLVTDFTGTLTDPELSAIRDSLESAYESNGMDGHVIIALSTAEWDIDEYVKDYADFLQGRGLIDSSGWLIYISTADRKFAVAAQDVAAKSFTPFFMEELRLIMSDKLEQGDLAGALTGGIDAIAELGSPGVSREKKGMSADILIFAGIVVLILAMMIRLRSRKKGV